MHFNSEYYNQGDMSHDTHDRVMVTNGCIFKSILTPCAWNSSVQSPIMKLAVRYSCNINGMQNEDHRRRNWRRLCVTKYCVINNSTLNISDCAVVQRKCFLRILAQNYMHAWIQ